MFLTTMRILGVGQDLSDLTDHTQEQQRYHPNGSEPVYVGIFGK